MYYYNQFMFCSCVCTYFSERLQTEEGFEIHLLFEVSHDLVLINIIKMPNAHHKNESGYEPNNDGLSGDGLVGNGRRV